MTRSRLWTLGTAGVVVVVLLAGWFLLIGPQRSEAADLRADTRAKEEANAQTQVKIDQLKALQKEVPAWEKEIARIARQVPDDPRLAELIRQMTDASTTTDVEVTTIQPGAVTPMPNVQGVAYIPVQLTVVGRYSEVMLFMQQLEENTRSILVTGFTAKKSDDAEAVPGQISVDVQTRIFLTKESADPATGGAPTSAATPAATGAATPSSTDAAAPAATNAA